MINLKQDFPELTVGQLNMLTRHMRSEIKAARLDEIATLRADYIEAVVRDKANVFKTFERRARYIKSLGDEGL